MDGFLTDVVYNPDRILHPLKRVGAKGEGRFERVGWDEALDAIASRLRRVRDESGGEAILPYSFAGTMGVAQGSSLDRHFFACLGASELARTICGSTAGAGVGMTLGSENGILQEDLLDSRFIIVWGGNPVVTAPHGWPILQRAREAGARLVSIDPLRSATAARADWHVRPHPGTDAALALGMMHVIVREGLHDRDYLDRHTVGFPQLEERLAEYPPERVAAITGLAAEEIVELATAYASTRPAAIQVSIGLEKHEHGGMIYRSIACLPALVGAWKERGGGLTNGTWTLFGQAMNWDGLPALAEPPQVRTINMVQLGGALTDPDLDPPIRALVVYNANPATIAPNQNRVVEGLRRDDLFTVVLEHFVTDTALYADYVLPATTQAEHLDLIVPWGSRYLALNQPAIEPRGETLPNSEIFRRLARRMELDEPGLQSTDEELLSALFESDHPYLEGITWERMKRDGWASLNLPEPHVPFRDGGFPTASGKCELYSAKMEEQGMDPLPAYVAVERSREAVERHPLQFMSPKWSRHFVNSSHANQPRLEGAAGKPRLRIHPDDAERRGIAPGATIRVFNGRGAIELEAEVTDAMLPGVVAMLHGWWASRIGGSSANALTGEGLADLGGGSRLHDVWVEVERAS
jgi:anaerobic selenocysteine-containing dehydrogenase